VKTEVNLNFGFKPGIWVWIVGTTGQEGAQRHERRKGRTGKSSDIQGGPTKLHTKFMAVILSEHNPFSLDDSLVKMVVEDPSTNLLQNLQ